ncbi:MAG TPA: universal stress protein [Bryobacteraceae bacterium]|jgi:nucleotide-binding universal stress UspA family protein|nr:universal stress protein [Bryobacteraceae bacterium]
MIGKILFPVDFSASCAAMASYVKRAAAMFGSQVTLIHVCDLASHNGFELYVRSLEEIAEEHWSIARRKLDSFLESEFPLATCPRVLCSGEAAAQIAEVARTRGFDLIIMPTHAGRFRQMLLGSTTAKVLNDADSLVLTTEHAAAVVPRPLEHRNWVCAIGLSPDSERVLRLAGRAATEVRAKLSIIHAIHDGSRALNARGRLDELQKTVGSDATVQVVTGPPKEALLDAARRSAADVLIIGRTARSGALGRMRDLTYAVVRDSPFPVLSV